MSGFLHLIVPKARFKLLSGEKDLTNYQFNTGIAQHLFCSDLWREILLRAALASGRLQRQRALPG